MNEYVNVKQVSGVHGGGRPNQRSSRGHMELFPEKPFETASKAETFTEVSQ